jgi:hypothetical protein
MDGQVKGLAGAVALLNISEVYLQRGKKQTVLKLQKVQYSQGNRPI